MQQQQQVDPAAPARSRQQREAAVQEQVQLFAGSGSRRYNLRSSSTQGSS
jgi:hypothetical protein